MRPISIGSSPGGARANGTLKTPVWADARPGPLFKALTLDHSVMHVGLAGYIDPASPGVTALDVEPGKFNAMLARTLDTFSRTANGLPRIIAGAGYGRYDRFYEAKGRFNAFVGCNTWTDGVLRAGGFRTGWWNPLPQSLEFSLRLFNRLPDAGISKGQ